MEVEPKLDKEAAIPKFSVPEIKRLSSKGSLWRTDSRTIGGGKLVSPKLDHSFSVNSDISRCLSPLKEDVSSSTQLEPTDPRSPSVLQTPSVMEGRKSSLSPMDGRMSSTSSPLDFPPRAISEQGEKIHRDLKRKASSKVLTRAQSTLGCVMDADKASLRSVDLSSPSIQPVSPNSLKRQLQRYSSTNSLRSNPLKPSRQALSSWSLRDVPGGVKTPPKGRRMTPDQHGSSTRGSDG